MRSKREKKREEEAKAQQASRTKRECQGTRRSQLKSNSYFLVEDHLFAALPSSLFHTLKDAGLQRTWFLCFFVEVSKGLLGNYVRVLWFNLHPMIPFLYLLSSCSSCSVCGQVAVCDIRGRAFALSVFTLFLRLSD
jgi:hypothetical protein